MEFLLNRFRNLTVLLVVVLGQLLLLAYQVKSNQDIRLIRVWSVTAVTPVAKVLEVVRRNTIGLVEDYFVLINVREENLRLTKELGNLKMENHFLKSELETSERAQALNAFPRTNAFANDSSQDYRNGYRRELASRLRRSRLRQQESNAVWP